jgi:hypothetical protein
MMKDFIKQVQELNANEIPNSVKKSILDKYIHAP